MPGEYETELLLQKVTGRQRRPSSGDVFRLQLLNGDYYFGVVTEGHIKAGPFSPFGVLAVIFAERSADAVLADFDLLARYQLLVPPFISYPRLWTVGYAEKIGETKRFPEVEYVFADRPFEKFVDQYGNEVAVSNDTLIGEFGIGDEHALSRDIAAAINR